MANYDPDKQMFDAVKESIKHLQDTLTQWQQKETAMHSMAQAKAKESGAPPEHMDAHVYAHKQAIKKAMAEAQKAQEQNAQQGAPTGQDMPGGPTSQVVPGPQGSQGTPGGSMTAGPGPLTGPPTGPTPGGQGGPGQPNPQLGNSGQGRPVGNPPGMVPTPHVPMAGQSQNTGANGWEGLMKPSGIPPQAQIQNGQRPESTGPTTSAQRPMPGMPTPPVPGVGSGPNTMRPFASQTPVLPSAQPPLTRPMR